VKNESRNTEIKSPKVHQKRLVSILGVLGMLLTPTGLITLLSSLFQLENQITALFALSTLIATCILYYRDLIGRIFPSYIALLTGLIVLNLSVFVYRDILFKDTGLLIYWHKSGDIAAQVRDDIAGSENEVFMFGTSFYWSIPNNKDLLLDKLNNGVTIKFLILNPNCRSFDDIAKDFGQTPEALMDECSKTIRDLISLNKSWNNIKANCLNPGDLQVRLYSNFPKMRGYIFDPANSKSSSILIPYLNFEDSPQLPAYKISNRTDGVFGQYYPVFNRLWLRSPNLEDFLKSNPTWRE